MIDEADLRVVMQILWSQASVTSGSSKPKYSFEDVSSRVDAILHIRIGFLLLVSVQSVNRTDTNQKYEDRRLLQPTFMAKAYKHESFAVQWLSSIFFNYKPRLPLSKTHTCCNLPIESFFRAACQEPQGFQIPRSRYCFPTTLYSVFNRCHQKHINPGSVRAMY
ncbi:hypothetical protein QCA50_012370 [Cerrena zonata]|uniref:Uncharacterized protein n=1 Tax=Cerrena zonata TaxID=2478898 RepID=A0AAW0G3B3_9APHY